MLTQAAVTIGKESWKELAGKWACNVKAARVMREGRGNGACNLGCERRIHSLIVCSICSAFITVFIFF